MLSFLTSVGLPQIIAELVEVNPVDLLQLCPRGCEVALRTFLRQQQTFMVGVLVVASSVSTRHAPRPTTDNAGQSRRRRPPDEI